jgi:hypothetical protein
MESGHPEWERQQRIQLAAYYLWQQRGCPFGAPEVDWFRAEEQLREGINETSPKPTLVTVAEAVGSALGLVAGHAASVVSLVRSDELAGSEHVQSQSTES